MGLKSPFICDSSEGRKQSVCQRSKPPGAAPSELAAVPGPRPQPHGPSPQGNPRGFQAKGRLSAYPPAFRQPHGRQHTPEARRGSAPARSCCAGGEGRQPEGGSRKGCAARQTWPARLQLSAPRPLGSTYCRPSRGCRGPARPRAGPGSPPAGYAPCPGRISLRSGAAAGGVGAGPPARPPLLSPGGPRGAGTRRPGRAAGGRAPRPAAAPSPPPHLAHQPLPVALAAVGAHGSGGPRRHAATSGSARPGLPPRSLRGEAGPAAAACRPAGAARRPPGLGPAGAGPAAAPHHPRPSVALPAERRRDPGRLHPGRYPDGGPRCPVRRAGPQGRAGSCYRHQPRAVQKHLRCVAQGRILLSLRLPAK